jgi:hypothetical protein
MRVPFNPYSRNYHSLSVRDLLEAREAYHVHLMAMDNVFATAIGLYRIHDEAPDSKAATTEADAATRGTFVRGRTFSNSSVKDWSWPCVLVIVKRWMSPDEVRKHPEAVAPPFLYLADGRMIPVCVVVADLYGGQDPVVKPVSLVSSGLGPGFPIVTNIQERDRVGTISCLVRTTERYYALTAQHVVGPFGTDVLSAFDTPGGSLKSIGVSAGSELKKRPFEQVYPTLPGPRSLCNLDVGLLEMRSIERWSSDMRELGPLGPLLDFNDYSASLDWIRRRVLGFGASSQKIEGEIWALFYRYLNVAGVDYIADFLIGGHGGAPLPLNPGDSGTLLCIAKEEFANNSADSAELKNLRMRPFAMVWGGQKLIDGDSEQYTQFGLATSLATACRELDVELVTDWRREAREYWGQVGHYKIAELAIELLAEPLKTFFRTHAELITFPGIDEPKTLNPATDFIPLADVPDLVWKSNINKTGVGVRANTENPNHYADIDLPTHASSTTIGDLPLEAEEWLKAYDALDVKWQHQGLLPFRVWQIFDAMVGFVHDHDTARYLCAAGILAHYVGDACQPLHGSQHADGLNGAQTGVHVTYEDRMVDDFSSDLAPMITDAVGHNPSLQKATDGKDAAKRLIEMMKNCQQLLAPEDICKNYNQHHHGAAKRGGDPVAAKALFQAFGSATADCIALGIRMLASLWTSAYKAGHGKKAMLTKVADHQLRDLYIDDPDFIHSYNLSKWIENVPH